MFEIILELFYALTGSLGFSLLFNLRKEHLATAVLGGTAEWAVYMAAEWFFGDGVFLPSVAAAAFAAVYAEVVARVKHAPATVFYIPALVPMIPGGSLYYTMSYAVRSDWEQVNLYAGRTMYCAVGIAVGLSLVLSVDFTIRKITGQKGNKTG